MKYSTLDRMIENLTNGNLSDARASAQSFEPEQIFRYLVLELGYSHGRARLTSRWLKGEDCWQEMCDTK